MILSELYHYGIKRRSGRYPWGSGEKYRKVGSAESGYQRSKDFVAYVTELRRQNLSEREIAQGMGISQKQLRARLSIAREEKHAGDVALVVRLKDKGYSNSEIARRMETSESNIRLWLEDSTKIQTSKTRATADVLKDAVESQKYVDVGVGVERHLGISRTRLKTSVQMLVEEGDYKVQYIQETQLGTGKKTSYMVLTKADVPYAEVYKNRSEISMPGARTEDGGFTYDKIEPPRSISSKRVMVRYAEDGGVDMDGVIELRRGVEDLSLGQARYAQVRIAVDGTHYLKGMAIYADDLPDGVDIRFNTNKTRDVPKMEVLKKLKNPITDENPFGANIKLDDELVLAQRHYIGSDGKRHLSSINIVNEEGDWGKWSKSLSSQVLSKQPLALAEKQLRLDYEKRAREFDSIMKLTNPTVREKLLSAFADECDSAAVHLKGAALPRQASHVILPFPKMKEDEVYAPNYRDGERVALIRYPHGGRFEIPELVVNNKYGPAKKTIGNAVDAVGINPAVAKRLSGADFDGDTVLVIPNNSGAIKTMSPLAKLKDFDPSAAYPGYPGMKPLTERGKAKKMGEVSNLITDMTIRGATDPDEYARAVRHSMVVIDAVKHNLNYRQSYLDNGIRELEKKYQDGGGAATLISRSKNAAYVNERVEGQLVTDPKTGKTRRLYVDPQTGKKLYTETAHQSIKKVANSDGTVSWVETGTKKVRSTKMYETDDAYTLSSGTPMEGVYAQYANNLKALGNRARLATQTPDKIEYSPSARQTYSDEVSSLNAKLNIALKNAPLERKAQLLANKVVSAKREANPDMDADEIKKIKSSALKIARARTGAGKVMIEITDKEWEAIQRGAVSQTTLKKILDNTDLDRVKNLATPRTSRSLDASSLARARNLLNSGYTQSEVADLLGISTTTLMENINA